MQTHLKTLLAAAALALTTVACAPPGQLTIDGTARPITSSEALNLGEIDGKSTVSLQVLSDPELNAADDELTIEVRLAFADLEGLALGEAIDIDGEQVSASFSYGCFCVDQEEFEPGSATGTVTIVSIDAEGVVRGSAELVLEGNDDKGVDMGRVELSLPFDAVPGASVQPV